MVNEGLVEIPSALTFEDFFEQNRHQVLRAVIAATGDYFGAEDATAEAFARTFQSWEDIRMKSSPAAWVVRVAINIHIDGYRRQKTSDKNAPSLSGDEVVDAPQLPIDPQLLTAIKSLPIRQREVIAYRILLGLSSEETAQQLGLTAGSVGTHLHRALNKLRGQFAIHPSQETL